MELLPKELEAQLPPLYSTEHLAEDARLIYAHYFCPFSSWDWYVLEYDPEDRMFFGLVDGLDCELGYFTLAEFEEVNKRALPLIERDLHWTPIKLSEKRASIEEQRNPRRAVAGA